MLKETKSQQYLHVFYWFILRAEFLHSTLFDAADTFLVRKYLQFTLPAARSNKNIKNNHACMSMKRLGVKYVRGVNFARVVTFIRRQFYMRSHF